MKPNRVGSTWVGGCFGVLGLLASAPAFAQEEPASNAAAPNEAVAASAPEAPAPPAGPRTANSIQLGVGFRYGALLSEGDLNPWGPGLGLDVGYTLPQAVYLGGSFEYFFGDSVQVAGGTTFKLNLWQLSAEGGYDVGLGEHFVIRPKLGVGIASVRSSFDGCPAGFSCESTSKTKPLIAPGVTFMLFTRVSLALDVRYALVLADPNVSGLIFSAGIGF